MEPFGRRRHKRELTKNVVYIDFSVNSKKKKTPIRWAYLTCDFTTALEARIPFYSHILGKEGPCAWNSSGASFPRAELLRRIRSRGTYTFSFGLLHDHPHMMQRRTSRGYMGRCSVRTIVSYFCRRTYLVLFLHEMQPTATPGQTNGRCPR